MPKITAPTLAEHRRLMQQQLVDAAEALLRNDPHSLTAAAVAKSAGIARNSIYRYVDHVDDLRVMVINQHLPIWISEVDKALSKVSDDGEWIVTWMSANLDQAARTGHGWLIALARSMPNDEIRQAQDGAHELMGGRLSQRWRNLLPPEPARVAVGITRSMLDSGFGQLEAGTSLHVVNKVSTDSIRAMIERLCGPGSVKR